MKISTVAISKETVYKIYKKHGVSFSEVKDVLLGNPYVSKTKFEAYLAIGKTNRYITIIFAYDHEIADIITAYPSSDWQINLFKRKKEK